MTSLFWSNVVNGKRNFDTVEQTFFPYLNTEEVMKICRSTFKIVILQVEIKLGNQRKVLKKNNVRAILNLLYIIGVLSVFILVSDY